MSLPFKKHLIKKGNYAGGKSKPNLEGKTIHKLSSNENQLGSSPLALSAVNSQINMLSEYPDRNDTRFRKALSLFYNNELSPDQFITFNGGVRGMELIMMGFVEEGSNCIYSSPGFGPYKSFPKKYGAESINIPLIGDSFELDVNGILNVINDKTRIIFVGSPNNPTGNIHSKAKMDALVNGLPPHVILIYDEVYYQYADSQEYVRGYEYVLQGKNVIGLNSFSKAYGLAGMRIGYAYCTKEIAQYLHQIRTPFLINRLNMAAAIAALNDSDFINKTVNLVHREREYLYDELTKKGIKFWRTQSNFILIEPKMESKIFEQKMLEEGIMVRPADNFGYEGIRVTIGTHYQNQAFVHALNKIINLK